MQLWHTILLQMCDHCYDVTSQLSSVKILRINVKSWQKLWEINREIRRPLHIHKEGLTSSYNFNADEGISDTCLCTAVYMSNSTDIKFIWRIESAILEHVSKYPLILSCRMTMTELLDGSDGRKHSWAKCQRQNVYMKQTTVNEVNIHSLKSKVTLKGNQTESLFRLHVKFSFKGRDETDTFKNNICLMVK